MFVVGKRKCGVGRFHSKEHVYVTRKFGPFLFYEIRKKQEKNNSANLFFCP